MSFLNRDSSLFDERKKPFLGEFYTSRQDYSPSRFRSGWISSSSRALKSGNAWLRHLKKTPRESAFSRANTRCRFHTGRPLLLKLFSTPGRRPTSRARGRPPKLASISNRLPPFLPSFLSNPRHIFLTVRYLHRSIDRTDLESLIRIHSRTLSTRSFTLRRTSFHGFSRTETFVEFERRAENWYVSRIIPFLLSPRILSSS